MPQEWLHLNGLEDPVWILILVLITMGDTVFFHELRETSLLIPLYTESDIRMFKPDLEILGGKNEADRGFWR